MPRLGSRRSQTLRDTPSYDDLQKFAQEAVRQAEAANDFLKERLQTTEALLKGVEDSSRMYEDHYRQASLMADELGETVSQCNKEIAALDRTNSELRKRVHELETQVRDLRLKNETQASEFRQRILEGSKNRFAEEFEKIKKEAVESSSEDNSKPPKAPKEAESTRAPPDTKIPPPALEIGRPLFQ